MEKREKSNSSLKAIIVVLAILLVGSLAFMYKMSTDNEASEKKFVTEKEQLIADLEAAKKQYSDAEAQNSELEDDFEEERAKVQELLEQVKKAEGDVAALNRYKQQYFKLKKEMDNLIAENKMLKEENVRLLTERDSTMTALNDSKTYNDTLINQNERLSKTIDKASKLTIIDLKAEPYKQRRSGKLIATDRARRVDLLKIGFTIAANEVADAGEKVYHVQVIDPKNNVLGDKKTEVFGEYTLTYSFITNAKYENETIKVSEELKGDDFEKGTYYVNLFDKDKLVGSSTFTLD